jgi:hypothetical protein
MSELHYVAYLHQPSLIHIKWTWEKKQSLPTPHPTIYSLHSRYVYPPVITLDIKYLLSTVSSALNSQFCHPREKNYTIL